MDFLSMNLPALNLLVAGMALAIGLALGALVQTTRFCSMAAVAEAVAVKRFDHARAWALAILVALTGTQLLVSLGYVNTSASIYGSPQLFWAGAVLGGGLFGVGMVQASGCGLRSLVNAGAGDLRALIAVAAMALFAYASLRGVLAPAQILLRDTTAVALEGAGSQDIAALVSSGLNTTDNTARLTLTALFAVALGAFVFRSDAFRKVSAYSAAGLGIGLLVVAGWWVTGVVGVDEFEPRPVTSLSVVAPVADSMIYAMTFTGAEISFGVALALGIVAGSAAIALINGSFKATGFTSTADTVRYLRGGALMGVGGVIAGGCTLGQGVTGVATLSLGSLLALLSTVASAAWAVQRRERRLAHQPAAAGPAVAITALPGGAVEFNACGN